MSDIITFNTETSVKSKPVLEKKAIFNLVADNDPILREVMPEFNFDNPPVNPNSFASTLVETCKFFKGFGLSANQCGFRHRVFVMGCDDEYVAFFNPKVINQSTENITIDEGCLSFPFLTLKISRPKEIFVEYQDYNGNIKNTKFVGISARCFLHELDHMNGIVYTSKTKPMALQFGMKKRNKLIKKMKLK